jgi:hypothetical protein
MRDWEASRIPTVSMQKETAVMDAHVEAAIAIGTAEVLPFK